MPVLPEFSGGSTFVAEFPVTPKVWMTPTDGFPGSPTCAIEIVTTPRLGIESAPAPDCAPNTNTALTLANIATVNPVRIQAPRKQVALFIDSAPKVVM